MTTDLAARGHAIRAARKRAGMTQPELGRLVGASARAIRDIEKGKTANPSTLPAVLHALELTEIDLNGDAPTPEGPARAGENSISDEELAELRDVPREIFIALLVWGLALSEVDEDEWTARIARISRDLLRRND